MHLICWDAKLFKWCQSMHNKQTETMNDSLKYFAHCSWRPTPSCQQKHTSVITRLQQINVVLTDKTVDNISGWQLSSQLAINFSMSRTSNKSSSCKAPDVLTHTIVWCSQRCTGLMVTSCLALKGLITRIQRRRADMDCDQGKDWT